MSISPPVLVRQLAENGIIDRDTFAIFEELRQLRNQASHTPQFQPSSEHAKEYVDLAFRLADRFRRIAYRPLSNVGEPKG